MLASVCSGGGTSREGSANDSGDDCTVAIVTRRRRRVLAGVALVATVGLTGCSNTQEPVVPVVPTPGQSSVAGTDAPGGTGPVPSPSSTTGVPELCSELASSGQVAQILKVPMQGETRRIYNDEFLPDSGRTGRLTCSYGVPVPPEGATPPPAPAPAPTPAPVPLRVAVSGYTDAETASGRIGSTVDSAYARGGQVVAQSVAGRDGFLLSDAEDISFVVADGIRTYVITLRHGVVPADAEKVVLVELATFILDAPDSEDTQ